MKLLNMQDATMPALGFGTWQLRGEACVKAVGMALDMGYRHIDTAQIYENEAEVGQGVEASGVLRSELFITTKLWFNNFTQERVSSSFEESLNKLRMDYVDLLLIHWPSKDVPLAETLGAMQALLSAGKTRAIGVSNFPVREMRLAVEEYKAPIACNQVECHVLLPQDKVRAYAGAHNMVVTAYSPLGQGKIANHPVLEAIGKPYGKTAGQVALRWLMEQDQVAAIPKAASEKNARANFEIFDFELSDDDLKKIAALSTNTRFINPDFAPDWDAV